ncbi:hypothetical protein, partial [Campylobacter concisus]|uniref:hypothetical protein n=1 Tax=Campylobacter concisus TaxID=199 RepID=UPI001CA4AD5C
QKPWLGSFISLNLVLPSRGAKFSSLWQVLFKFQLASNLACSTKFKAQKVKFTKSALGVRNLTASIVASRQSWAWWRIQSVARDTAI